MHSSENFPAPCHCTRFDTTLLAQIVAVEVDTAVHRLLRDKGIRIDANTQKQWAKTVLQHVEDLTFKEVNAHCFLPGVLQQRMTEEIERIVHEEIIGTFQSLQVTQMFPMRRLCWYRPVLSAVRFLFNKNSP